MAEKRQLRTYPDIFVNRDNYIELFNNAIDAIPDSGSPLVRVFYGAAGQGKSALRHHLTKLVRSKSSRRYQRSRAAEVNLRKVDQSAPINLLVHIRKAFLEAGVKLEAFDVALAIEWENTQPDRALPELSKSNWAGEIAEGTSSTLPEEIDSIAGMVPFGRIAKWGYDKAKVKWIIQRNPYLGY